MTAYEDFLTRFIVNPDGTRKSNFKRVGSNFVSIYTNPGVSGHDTDIHIGSDALKRLGAELGVDKNSALNEAYSKYLEEGYTMTSILPTGMVHTQPFLQASPEFLDKLNEATTDIPEGLFESVPALEIRESLGMPESTNKGLLIAGLLAASYFILK